MRPAKEQTAAAFPFGDMVHPRSAACLSSMGMVSPQCTRLWLWPAEDRNHCKQRTQRSVLIAPCRPRYCGHHSRPWQQQQTPQAKRPASPSRPRHLLEMTRLHRGATQRLLRRRLRMEQRLQPVQPTTAHVVAAETRLTPRTLSCSCRTTGLFIAGADGSGAWLHMQSRCADELLGIAAWLASRRRHWSVAQQRITMLASNFRFCPFQHSHGWTDARAAPKRRA